MPNELRPKRLPKPKGPDDRLERLKGEDPKPVTEDKNVLEAAFEIFEDDLEAPEEVEALIAEMSKEDEEKHAATVVTPEGVVADAATGEVLSPPPAEPKKHAWKPSKKDFIKVRGGGEYLPARMRINWLRGGDPEPHPDWAIYTNLKHFEQGTRKSAGRVEGGFAMFEATIVDELGRHISSGHKTEYSENFADFVEKAETGAIARALAVAGYGTESAIDIDEGYEKDRIADAPVGGQPIVISGSDVKDVRQGGRQKHITSAQIKKIAGEVKRLGITPIQLGQAMETLFEDMSFDSTEDIGPQIDEALGKMTFEEAGTLVQALMNAEPPEGGDDDEDEENEGEAE